jgi:hypothetical protein
MVRAGQRIDDLEFEFYQNDDIKRASSRIIRASGWCCFYPADFTFTRFRSRQNIPLPKNFYRRCVISSAAMSSDRQGVDAEG